MNNLDSLIITTEDLLEGLLDLKDDSIYEMYDEELDDIVFVLNKKILNKLKNIKENLND